MYVYMYIHICITDKKSTINTQTIFSRETLASNNFEGKLMYMTFIPLLLGMTRDDYNHLKLHQVGHISSSNKYNKSPLSSENMVLSRFDSHIFW